MVNYKYTDQLPTTKSLYRNENYVEMKHCVEINTKTN